jgi:hypothetical protein
MYKMKPINELSLEKLCLHFQENQQIIEKEANRKNGELILFCERCGSPYNIVLRPERPPYCATCCYQSKITIKEFTLASGIDRYLKVLCRLLVRAVGQLNEDKARMYLETIYEYISGNNSWDDQELFIDNPITWYPHDFFKEYDQYASCQSKGIPDEKPDKDGMLEMLYKGVAETIQERDRILHKVGRRDIPDLLKLGMVIRKKTRKNGKKEKQKPYSTIYYGNHNK